MRNNRTWANLVPYLLMLPILIFLTSTAMRGNNIAMTYGQFVELLNRKDAQIEQVQLTLSNTVIDVKGIYTDKNGEKGFQVTLPNTETVNNGLVTTLQSKVKDGNIKIVDAYKTNPLIEALVQVIPLIIVTAVGIYFISRMSGSQNNKAFEFSKSRARLEGNIKVRFSDVAGCDEEKEEVAELISYLKGPEKYAKMGARIPKGILMVGPPGTGKTLLAKAVAGEADVPFYSISGADFVEMFVGVGASRVRDMFKKAKSTAPCMVFIDEIDAVGRQRGAGLGGGNDEREQTLNMLLVEMDGIEDNKGIVVIAATNRPDVLDPALLRPGRFDRQITVNLPDKNGRKAILEVHARNKRFEDDVDLGALAARTPGFSGADLENVLNEAAILAVRENRDRITMSNLDEAIDRTMGGPAKKSRKYSDREKTLVATHEAGHAESQL